jgi:protein-arginine kinase activator protein McsA
MGELLPRVNKEILICTNCKEKPAIFEYVWGIAEEILLCEDCAKMVSSNVTKDILKRDPNFLSIFKK